MFFVYLCKKMDGWRVSSLFLEINKAGFRGCKKRGRRVKILGWEWGKEGVTAVVARRVNVRKNGNIPLCYKARFCNVDSGGKLSTDGGGGNTCGNNDNNGGMLSVDV